MFGAAADLITLHELDGTVRLASESCRTILGIAPEALIGRTPAETYLYAEDVPVLAVALDRLRKSDTVQFTCRARAEAGKPEWLETKMSVVRDPNGSATGFLAISRVVTDRLESDRRLHAQLERYSQLTEAIPGMTVWIVDRDLRCRFAAGAGLSSTGFDAANCVDRPLSDLLGAERLLASQPHLDEAFAGRSSAEEDTSRAGHHFWIQYIPVPGHSGSVEEVLVVTLEVTDREHTHEALRRSEASFSSAFDSSPIGMVMTAPDGSVLRVNDAFCDLSQRSREELHSGTLLELIHPDELEDSQDLTSKMLGGQTRTAMTEKRLVRPDLSVVHVLMSTTIVRDEAGGPLHLVTQVLDVTDRRRLETYLEELALRDPLTGAHNRRVLDVELARRLSVESSGPPRGAVVVFDIDHFKQVNDTFGHQIGDDVLRHLVAAWRHRLRRADVLVRTGGDEFVVLLGDAEPGHAELVARDLVEIADEAILTVTGVATSVSAGMALFRPDEDPDKLLRRADDALYLAKRAGRGRLMVDPADLDQQL